MIIIFYFFFLDVYSLTIKTEDIVVISKEDEIITLNCTYHSNNSAEKISEIRWRIRVKNVFKDVAIFYPSGLYEPFIAEEIVDLYKNRTVLIGPNTTQLSAVMIIKNPVCTDEGTYQCWIQYTIIPSVTYHVTNDTTSVQFNGKYIFSMSSRIFIFM